MYVYVIITLAVLAFIIFTFLFWQVDNVYKRRTKIVEAIHAYNVHEINKDPNIDDMYLIPYTCMETFDQTCHRFWDFKCDRIVPSDVYILIKDYIQ